MSLRPACCLHIEFQAGQGYAVRSDLKGEKNEYGGACNPNTGEALCAFGCNGLSPWIPGAPDLTSSLCLTPQPSLLQNF